MLTETPMSFSVRVSSMTVVWYVPAGTVTVAEPAPWTVTWVLTVRAWPATLTVAVIVLVCGWPDMICAWAGQTIPPDLILNVLLPSEGSGIETEPLEPNRNVSLTVVPCRRWVVVTWSPPATGTTAVTLSVAVPAGRPAVVTWYTQVSPTAAGKSSVPVKDVPGPALPAAGDAFAPAGDEPGGDEPGDEVAGDGPEPQPARARPVTASNATQPAGRREVEPRRFMVSGSLSWHFGVDGETSKYPSGGALAWCPSVSLPGRPRAASYPIDAAGSPPRSPTFAWPPIEIYRGCHCRR